MFADDLRVAAPNMVLPPNELAVVATALIPILLNGCAGLLDRSDPSVCPNGVPEKASSLHETLVNVRKVGTAPPGISTGLLRLCRHLKVEPRFRSKQEEELLSSLSIRLYGLDAVEQIVDKACLVAIAELCGWEAKLSEEDNWVLMVPLWVGVSGNSRLASQEREVNIIIHKQRVRGQASLARKVTAAVVKNPSSRRFSGVVERIPYVAIRCGSEEIALYLAVLDAADSMDIWPDGSLLLHVWEFGVAEADEPESITRLQTECASAAVSCELLEFVWLPAIGKLIGIAPPDAMRDVDHVIRGVLQSQ